MISAAESNLRRRFRFQMAVNAGAVRGEVNRHLDPALAAMAAGTAKRLNRRR